MLSRQSSGHHHIGISPRRVSNDYALPDLLETEDNGAVRAYVPGLPVYAAADSHAKAERAIRATLTEHLSAHPTRRPRPRGTGV